MTIPDAPELPDFDGATATYAPLRILAEDGTMHFSDLKRLAKSGRQYLSGVNRPRKPTSAMLIGTAVHQIVLGLRPGAPPLVCYRGGIRRGKEWESFKAQHNGAEIISESEWDAAIEIAEAVKSDPLAQERFAGAKFETPLSWMENDVPCSTSGIDIVCSGRSWRRGGATARSLGDLKTTGSVEPWKWKKQIETMHYAEQLVWYRRGARANGIEIDGDLFVLGVETAEPFEVYDYYLTDDDIDLAESTLALWLAEFRSLRDGVRPPLKVTDWPGYAQSPQPLNMSPARYALDDEAIDEEEAA